MIVVTQILKIHLQIHIVVQKLTSVQYTTSVQKQSVKTSIYRIAIKNEITDSLLELFI